MTSPNTSHQPALGSTWRVWLAVVSLGIGAFTIVTTELAPVGMLSSMADELARSEAAIGLTVTLYAWIGAISALASAIWLNRVPRKPLLIGLMLTLAISNATSALAENFEVLLASRALGAVSHGFFWAIIGACAAQIAPARHVGLATSIVFGGVSAANVVGVPLATLIGESSGWRWVFGAISTVCLAAATGLLLALPKLEAETSARSFGLRTVIGRRDLIGIYVATTFAVIAHFAAFTFIEPFLSNIPMSPTMVAMLVFGFGAAGLIGNVLSGVFIDRFLAPFLTLALVTMCAALLVLGQYGHSIQVKGVGAALLAWGIAVAAIFVGFQTWILRAAREAAMPASAVYVAIFNAAIGTGALLGAWVYAHAELPIMTAAGLVSIVAIGVVVTIDRPRPAAASLTTT